MASDLTLTGTSAAPTTTAPATTAAATTNTTGWSTVFSSPDEFSPTRGSLVHTIPTLGKEWRVSLEFKPTDYTYSGYANLLHLTIGADWGSYGTRVPGVWFHPSRGLHISAAVNGILDYNKDTLTDRPPLGNWTSLEISQEQVGGEFVYKIVIGGKEILSVENTQPEVFEDVKVYASDPWHNAQPGAMKALLIQTKLGQFYFLILLVYFKCMFYCTTLSPCLVQ